MKYFNTLFGTALTVTTLGLAAAPAAAVPVINTTVDQFLGDCSVTCSLRDAVALASSGDTLHVPAGHYVLTLGDIVTTDKSLTIVGDGARSTILDGNGASRIFQFLQIAGPQALVEFTDLSLINGNAATPGPGFSLNGGALVGNDFSFTGSLTLRRCLFAGNQAQFGGAISWVGNLTIDQCTIEGNIASSEAGGILVLGRGSNKVTITNSTLTGNTAQIAGGASLNRLNTVNLVNVTVTANQAPSAAGLKILRPGTATIANSIIADNPGGDCVFSGIPVVSDHSLDSDSTCMLTGPGDLPGVAPLLGPLADNGGSTDTHALLAGSPAIDAGGICPPADQRGVARPQGPACDIGAFEVSATPEDQISALIAQVNELISDGDLAANKANPLINKLEQAFEKLGDGQTNAVCGQLGAFVNQVNAYIDNGTLTAAEGQALIDAVNAVKADIGC